MTALIASTAPIWIRLLLHLIPGLFVIYCCIILLIGNTKILFDKSYHRLEQAKNGDIVHPTLAPKAEQYTRKNVSTIIPIPVNKTDNATVGIKAEHIAIISILANASSRNLYKTAMDSMECYALQNNYTFMVLNSEDFRDICEQKDMTFQRHCIISHILKTNNFTWVLFVDSDIGVVNEKIRLEKYIKEDAHIIFYDRFFNFEVMAGTYLAKKSAFSTIFLRGWADYEFRLPKNFHGRDNGALHMWLLELLVPNAPLTPACWILWRKTTNFESLTLFTLCCREALKNSTFSQVHIYGKGEGWARDTWLTNSHWSPATDFMLHDLKEERKLVYNASYERVFQTPSFRSWFDTLRNRLNLEKCKTGEEVWNRETALVTDKQTIEPHLNYWREWTGQHYRIKLQSLHDLFSRYSM